MIESPSPRPRITRPARRTLASSVALALAAGVALAGCIDGDDGRRAGDPVTVYVSLPQRGPSGPDGRDAADGARLALAEAEGRAGGREVRAALLDDTVGRGAAARWSAARAGRNARRATRDAAAIAYIGELESGATRTSLPITNEARILQVSPGSSAEDLVREPGTFDGVPERFQPSGERTFARVVPSDRAQAQAGARWAAARGNERATVVVERSAFGRTVADAFAEEAASAGIEVERRRLERLLAALPVADRPQAGSRLAECRPRPDLAAEVDARLGDRGITYFAGADQRALALLGCMLPLPGPLMATDALLPWVGALGGEETVNDVLLTSAAQVPAQLPPAGRDFVERFRDEYDRRPGSYAAYGYEAMAAVLEAIERAADGGGDRTQVIDAFLATADRDSVIGRYSIEPIGDTTLDRMTGYRLEGGRARPVAELRARGR
jgi:branched-chain amino acid transport system substrate-binding protein